MWDLTKVGNLTYIASMNMCKRRENGWEYCAEWNGCR